MNIADTQRLGAASDIQTGVPACDPENVELNVEQRCQSSGRSRLFAAMS